MKQRISIKKCVAALLGIFLVGAGIAFNAQAQLGNDAVGIFYDGIRNVLGLSGEQLGYATSVVNVAIVILLVFIGRRYVNIGTFIYILPYGFFVDLGTKIYMLLFPEATLGLRIVGVILGCLGIFLGVAIYIVADIGVDPFTGLTLRIGEKLNWKYRRAKIVFDVCLTVLGFLMGGKLGVITVVVTLCGGPIIQFFTDGLRKMFRIEDCRA